MAVRRLTFRALAISLPVVFALHVAEEMPEFVPWFNGYAEPDISEQSFWSVVTSGFVITFLIAALAAIARERFTAIAAIAWVSFVMLANALFHLTGAVIEWGYVPGVVTAFALYLPVSIAFIRSASRECSIPPLVAIAAALLGGLPMCLHGWLVLFEESRLF